MFMLATSRRLHRVRALNWRLRWTPPSVLRYDLCEFQVRVIEQLRGDLGGLMATEEDETPHPFGRTLFSSSTPVEDDPEWKLQRQPAPSKDGVSRIDNRRKAVNNTWVYIRRRPLDPVDMGPGTTPATTRPEARRAANAFLNHTQQSRVEEPLWDVDASTFSVRLTGQITASYTVNGRELKASLDVSLGNNYKNCYQALERRVRNEWILQAIEVGCLALARIDMLHGKLNRTAPKVAPAQIAGTPSLQEYLRDLEPHMERMCSLVPDGEGRPWLLRTLQEEFIRLQGTDARTSRTDLPFEEMWAPYRSRCPFICTVACGLATIYPNDAEIERVYAEYKYLFSERRRSTSVFSMTGMLMSKLNPPTPDQLLEEGC
eukprot:GHVU01041242.1.p1 GENE.GHVU01041242.1~~GHVU01041242.1.p1  ORF type:complete len:374 (+),score=32.94 GHVU01041242.1:2249-3370(+)